MLPVDNSRTGIVTHEQYRAIRDFLPPYARIALVISYHTGARKGEIQKIRLDKIDFKAGRIELGAQNDQESNGALFANLWRHGSGNLDVHVTSRS
jgi:integrase